MGSGYAKTGQYPTRKLVTGGTRKLVKGYAKTGHPSCLKRIIFNKGNLKVNGLQRRGRDVVTSFPFSFDWEKVGEDFSKFMAIPCKSEVDRHFILKAIALTQTAIPPFALWDALEAVKAIRPKTPIAYFRTVLRDNCRKADVDLDSVMKVVRIPPGFSTGTHKAIPPGLKSICRLPDEPAHYLPQAQQAILEALARIHHADRKAAR